MRKSADLSWRIGHTGSTSTPSQGDVLCMELLDAQIVPRPPRTVSKGADMPKVVITHAVVDIERWLKGKAERAEAIESGSGTNVTDYVAQDGSNNIAVTADVHDVDAMKAMLAAPPPEVVARMEEHGVVQPLTTYIEAD